MKTYFSKQLGKKVTIPDDTELTPAEQGEETARRINYMNGLCDEFKAFVAFSISEGHADICDDHFEVMKQRLEVFIEEKYDEEQHD